MSLVLKRHSIFSIIFLIILLIQIKFNNLNALTIQCSGSINLESPNYACSNGLLPTFESFKYIHDNYYTAESLSLTNNSLSNGIPYLAFNQFKMLKHTLNLSENLIDHVDEYGFYFSQILGFYYGQLDRSNLTLNPLKVEIIDFTRNRFKQVPWNALKSLPDLTHLYFDENKLDKLELGDDFKPNPVSFFDQTFSKLTHLYLRSCGIESIESDVFKYLSKLEYIDLSTNNVRFIDSKIGKIFSANYMSPFINLKRNPLQCDCNLLWYAKYLLHNKDLFSFKQYNTNDQMCLMNEKKSDGNQLKTVIVRSEFIDLNPQKSTNAFATFKKNLSNNMIEIDYKNFNNKNVSSLSLAEIQIINLSESEFACDIKFITDKKLWAIKAYSNKKYVVELICLVSGFPKPNINWNKDNTVIIKRISDDSNYKIVDSCKLPGTNNNCSSKDYENHQFLVESKLILDYNVITPSIDGYDNYSCRTKFDDSMQQVILFHVFHGEKLVIDKQSLEHATSNLNGLYLNAAPYNKEDLKVKELVNNKPVMKPREKPFIYWLMLIICILFALMVILFVAICILRNNYKNRKDERLFYSAGSSSNNSSFNKHSAIYLASESTRDSAVLQPLKPDVIREHQEYSSIYTNTNNRSPSRHSSPYSNILFSSPISLGPANNNTNNFNADQPYFIYKQNDFNNNDMPPPLLANDQSFDPNPVESSLIDENQSTSLSTSSRSFEENIEEYEDPKFDDLSKPTPKSKTDQTNESNTNQQPPDQTN